MTEDRKKELTERFCKIREQIREAEQRSGRVPGSVRLLAVSKNFPADDISVLNDEGQQSFGENRVQELLAKQEALKLRGLDWQLIGTLQTNKAKDITGRVSLIHSIDRVRILDAVERKAQS